jgi:GntR family transcriptional regulator
MQSPRHPKYQKVADILRERIEQGAYPPGTPLPPEGAMCSEHRVGLMTVRRAIAVLREEGLLRTQRGAPATVRTRPARRRLVLRPHDRLICRMPSRSERDAMRFDAGVPVLELRRPGAAVAMLPADQIEIIAPGR